MILGGSSQSNSVGSAHLTVQYPSFAIPIPAYVADRISILSVLYARPLAYPGSHKPHSRPPTDALAGNRSIGSDDETAATTLAIAAYYLEKRSQNIGGR